MTIEQLKELTSNPKILEFAELILEMTNGKDFPNYKEIDLMKIPALVSNVWVLDFSKIDKAGCLFHFSGTEVDENYGRNITGQSLEEIYSGDDYKELVEGCFQNVHFKKMTAYTKRWVHFHDGFVDKFRLTESILVPCSSDGETIDYGIGLAFYSISDEPSENVYKLI